MSYEYDDDLNNENWNDEIVEDLKALDYQSIVVYSRDWTIETIFNQIRQGNIDLDPKFQRRNAWNEEKRSRLIESLVLGLPVPEIVLAEHPTKRKSFIVIDGKQRLLTIAGFLDPENIAYWKTGKLSTLTQYKDLNGKTYKDISTDPHYSDVKREFDNADIRCTVISNYKDTDILYDIFYRLNTGSVPLSTQELRQVLNKGKFAEYLIEITESLQPIHTIMGLKGPDTRLRDIEIILRYISIYLYGEVYRGNLKTFLDDTMAVTTTNWETINTDIYDIYDHFNLGIKRLIDVFGERKVGRKYINGKFESRFNKALFEVQVYYFSKLTNEDIMSNESKDALVKNFEELCQNYLFRQSIESSTKNMTQYYNRFQLYRDYINSTLNKQLEEIPVPKE